MEKSVLVGYIIVCRQTVLFHRSLEIMLVNVLLSPYLINLRLADRLGLAAQSAPADELPPHLKQ